MSIESSLSEDGEGIGGTLAKAMEKKGGGE